MEREWLDISVEEYHEHPAYGSGAIRCLMLQGSAEFWAQYIAKTKRRSDSAAMRLGRAFHAAMETPEEWRERVEVIPSKAYDEVLIADINDAITGTAQPLVYGDELNFKMPTHREYRDRHQEAALTAGKDYISECELETLSQMISSVWDNPACRELLEYSSGLDVEACCVANHQSGVDIKALCDLSLGDAIVDFKTTREPTPHAFLRQSLKQGYQWQAAFYCLVTGKKRFFFVSVRNEAPYEANVFEVPQDNLKYCTESIEPTIYRIAELRTLSQMDEVDSQQMPLSWHNELWGSTLPLDIDRLNRMEEA